MSGPVVPTSHLGYFVRGDNTSDLYTGTSPAAGDKPLSSGLMAHEIGNNLAFVYDVQSQHVASWHAPDSSGREITFVSSDTGGKTGTAGGYAHLDTQEFSARLMPDGRPEPMRVLVLGARSSSDILIRCSMRYANEALRAPSPLNTYGLRDGLNVGQATFTSSTPSWKELARCSDASVMYALQMPVGTVPISRFSQSGTETGRDGWEPALEVRMAIDFWGLYSGGTAGTGALHGYMIRGEPGALIAIASAT